MTPLSLTSPLASLYDLARNEGRVDSIATLARRHGTSPQRFHAAQREGDGIRLATLAAYARAAGYVLWIIGNGLPGMALRQRVGEYHTMSVSDARALVEGWGLEMTLAVEPAEEAKR